jgi:curved DNA-binding protein CbpA
VTLYDILGASPRDTQQQLKLRYTSLVKRLHPDTNPAGGTANNGEYDLCDINAAWEILGDKKERLRYDRSLQAKEFTENVEAMVGLGIKTAIPWLKKTADTTAAAVDITAAAVDASARAAQLGAEQAKLAYGVFELEQQSKAMEQKSAAERLKAQRLQKEIDSLPRKRISTLTYKQKADIGFVEAQRILNTFQLDNVPATLSKELKVLQETEQLMKESLQTTTSTQRAISMAERKLEQALKAEIQAQKRLEEAERALAIARQNHEDARKLEADALLEDKTAKMNLDKVETSLQKTREKVRLGLSQQQDVYLDKLAKQMQAEKKELINSANELYSEAQALMRRAQELDRLQ